MSSYLLLVVFCFSVCSYTTMSANPRSESLIDQVCRKTEDYGFCNRAYHDRLQEESPDMKYLTEIAMDLTTENATVNSGFIARIIDNFTNPNDVKVLSLCKYNFEAIVSGFVEALQLLEVRDYKNMLAKERPAPKAIADCQAGYSFTEGTIAPLLNDRNTQLRILVTMSLVSGTMLSSGSPI